MIENWFRFENEDDTVEVYAPPKCGLLSFTALVDAGKARRSAGGYMKNRASFVLVRHPKSRLESFLRDKCWQEPKEGRLDQDCQKEMMDMMTASERARLKDGRSDISDVLSCMERGMTDLHLAPITSMVPAAAQPLRMELDTTWEILGHTFGPMPRLNETKKDVPVIWGVGDEQRLYDLWRLDYDLYGYPIK